MTLDHVFDTFCKELSYLRNRSPKTIRSYRQAFTSLQQSLRGGIEPPAGVVTADATGSPFTKTQLQAWVLWMRQRGLSPGACNVYIRSITSFLSWLHAEGNTPERLRLSLLKVSGVRPTTYDVLALRRLLGFKPRTAAETRIHALVQTLLDTGAE